MLNGGFDGNDAKISVQDKWPASIRLAYSEISVGKTSQFLGQLTRSFNDWCLPGDEGEGKSGRHSRYVRTEHPLQGQEKGSIQGGK
jgi:hypothetical protein